MTIRKFGRSDDQQVLADENDTQGVRKEATVQWTEKDRDELTWENEGGNGSTRK